MTTVVIAVFVFTLILTILFHFSKRLRGEVKLKTRSMEAELSARREAENELRVQAMKLQEEILDRKQIQAALQESEKRYRDLIESSHDLIWEVDVNGVYSYVSPQVAEILGYAPEEIVGKTPFALMPSEEAERVKAVFEETSTLRKPFLRLENINLHKNGSLVVLETSGIPFFDEQGNYLGYRGMDQNITGRITTQKALQDSEKHFRYLVEFAPEAIFVQSQGRFIYLNPLMLNLLGASKPEELLGLDFRQFVAPEYHDAIRESLRQQLQTGKPAPPMEQEYLRLDGSRVPVETTAMVINYPDRDEHLVFVRDISERKHAERFLKTIIDSEPECIKLLDIDCNLLMMNRAGLEMIEADSFEQVKGQSVCSLITPPYRDDFISLTKQVFQGIPGSLEFETVGLKGRRIWLETHAVPFRNENAEIISLLGITRDVTEHKHAEESLRKLSTAVKQSPVSIIITDTQGAIEFANPKFCQITGYTSEQILGKNPRFLKTGHTSPETYQQLWETISGGHIWEGDFLNKKKNGELFWERATISPIINTEGIITNYLAIKEDITEQKQLEDQLRHAQKMEAVGQLAGGVAHDFNNILQVIMTSATLLKMDKMLDSQGDEHVEQILSSSKRAANLTHDLLAFSRKQTMNLKTCDLNDIVQNIRKFLIRIIGEDIQLKSRCCEAHLQVNVDSGQIDQVLINLATNARDAMPKGGALNITTQPIELDEIFIQTHGYGKKGKYALIVVTDSGTGIDAQVQRKIFEPFFTTKGVGKGTGLGLSIVYGIIKKHNGYINVYSEPDKGTTFRIYLPIITDELKTNEPTSVTDIEKGTETILVVEDEEAVQWSMKAVLSQYGYNVILARDGQEGVDQFIAHRDKIKLVLMDIIMPIMNGRESAQRIRQMCPDCRVLFASGYTADIIKERGDLDVGEEIISKPVQPLELLRKIREMLDRK